MSPPRTLIVTIDFSTTIDTPQGPPSIGSSTSAITLSSFRSQRQPFHEQLAASRIAGFDVRTHEIRTRKYEEDILALFQVLRIMRFELLILDPAARDRWVRPLPIRESILTALKTQKVDINILEPVSVDEISEEIAKLNGRKGIELAMEVQMQLEEDMDLFEDEEVDEMDLAIDLATQITLRQEAEDEMSDEMEIPEELLDEMPEEEMDTLEERSLSPSPPTPTTTTTNNSILLIALSGDFTHSLTGDFMFSRTDLHSQTSLAKDISIAVLPRGHLHYSAGVLRETLETGMFDLLVIDPAYERDKKAKDALVETIILSGALMKGIKIEWAEGVGEIARIIEGHRARRGKKRVVE